MKRTHQSWLACALGLLIGLAATAGAMAADTSTKAAKPTIEDLFRHPVRARPVLSPDGKHLAIVMRASSGRDKLAVIDLRQRDKAPVITGLSDADVDDIYWVNDQRLVFTAHDLSNSRWMASGLFAVNHDGTEVRRLIDADGGRTQTDTAVIQKSLSYEWEFHSTLRNSDDVIVSRSYSNSTQTREDVTLARLNTKTRSLRVITSDAPPGVIGWVLDDDGVPRAAFSMLDGKSTAYWREKADAPWTVIAEWHPFTGRPLRPFHIARDGTLYVLAPVGERDTLALHRYDFAKKAVDPTPIIDLPGFDLNGHFEVDDSTGRVLGLKYVSDAPGTVWFDADMKAIQERVDAALPSTVNRLTCGRCEKSTPFVLVRSVSDRQPPLYHLYNRETKEVEAIGASMPWINPKQLGRSDFFRFKARDGLSIPVLVTYPPGPAKGPYPAVVMVHGGPWVDGRYWGSLDPDVQFLATRGYVVIEPSFRGTTGFGDKHYKSSWKQWGLAMQDDVADAALWAVKEKIADGERMCIAGASYGGYATLMGLARNPELFKCGINWVGVSDIELMYSITWSDSSDIFKRLGMPTLIGDRVKDKAQLDATSPIKQAAKIRQPLLMAYGRLDRRVPIEHGREFRDAVKPYNDKVEYIEYADEGHGWRLLETNVDFWTRVEKFLDTNIGAGAATK